MSQHSRLNTGQKEEQQPQSQLQEKQNATQARVFDTPEDLLRADAAQTEVPPAVEQRLAQSLESLPKPKSSWWRRLLGS